MAANLRKIVPFKQDDPKKYAYIMKLAIKYRSLAQEFRFEPLRAHHLPQLMDLSKGFCEDEPISQATGSTIENTRTGLEYLYNYAITANSVTGNSSQICYHNRDNKPIGILLHLPVYRDPKKAPFSVPDPILSTQEKTTYTPLDDVWNKMWDIYPNEDVFMKGELIYVDRNYRKDGLFHTFMDYDLDYQEMAKKTGANYWGALCTAHATKGWYGKLGYVESCTSPDYVINIKGEKVKLPHGPLAVYTSDMHKNISINVKPIWDKMKKAGML